MIRAGSTVVDLLKIDSITTWGATRSGHKTALDKET